MHSRSIFLRELKEKALSKKIVLPAFDSNKLKDNNDSDLMKDVDVANTSSASNIVAVGVLEDFSSDDSIADPIYLPQPGYSSSSDEGNSNIKRTNKTNMCQEDNKLKDNNDSNLIKDLDVANTSSASNIIAVDVLEDFSSDDSIADPIYLPQPGYSSSSDEGNSNTKRTKKTNMCQEDNNGSNSCNTEVVEVRTNNNKKDIKRGRSRRQRAECKKLRNLGKSYITEKGKIISERTMGTLKSCRMKCNDRITENDKKICFENYWNLGSRNKRASYVGSLIEINDKKTKKNIIDPKKDRSCSCSYHLIIDKQKVKVCRDCFQKILGETKGFVQLVIEKKTNSASGIIQKDQRGLASPQSKWSLKDLQDVKSHILSFPNYESHYCRNRTNKKFLPSNLTISKMFDLYKEGRASSVSLTIYTKIFRDLGLAFKKPKQDTCHKCDNFNVQIKLSSGEYKTQLIAERDEHRNMAQFAYEQKSRDKAIAKENQSKGVYAFDLQQCLPTPYLTTSVSFYKRQLWSFNLTVHDMVTDKATCYLWDETISGRGANEIASCLNHFLTHLSSEKTEVTFYSDTCGGQNKNNVVALMFLNFVNQKANLKINHKFLVSGHTHMECDTDHSVIERAKKKTNLKINYLNDWAQLIRIAKQKNPFEIVMMLKENFFDFNSLVKKHGPYIIKKIDNDGERFLWKPVQWLQYAQSGGQISFKCSLKEEDHFKTINFARRGRPTILFSLPNINNESVPIAAEKKKDLLSLLPLIDPSFHSFYQNLKTKNDVANDPDLEELDPDEDTPNNS